VSTRGLRTSTHPTRFRFFECWDSQESLDKHLGAPHEKAFGERNLSRITGATAQIYSASEITEAERLADSARPCGRQHVPEDTAESGISAWGRLGEIESESELPITKRRHRAVRLRAV